MGALAVLGDPAGVELCSPPLWAQMQLVQKPCAVWLGGLPDFRKGLAIKWLLAAFFSLAIYFHIQRQFLDQ